MTDPLAALGALITAIQKDPDLLGRIQTLVAGGDGLTDTERGAAKIIRDRCGPHLPTINAARTPDVVDAAFAELGARRLGTWNGATSGAGLAPPWPIVRSAIAAACDRPGGCPQLPLCARADRCLASVAKNNDGDSIDVPVIDRATGQPLPALLDGGTVDGAAAAPRSRPTKTTRRHLTEEQWRDAIVSLSQKPGGMTRAQLQKTLGVGKVAALNAIGRATKAGIIEGIGDRHAQGYHYRYVQPERGPTTHPRSDHPRATPGASAAVTAAARDAAGVAPVEGTGSTGKISSDPQVRRLVTRIKAAGGTVERLPGGHLRAHGPRGASVFGATPGSVGPVTISAIRNGTGLDIAL